MQVNDLASIDPNVDYTQILPIQQKRTIAFINHFVMNTVSFLNHFAQSCESRLMEFEYKLQKVEASLLILESQLSSVSGLEEDVEKESNDVIKEETIDLPEIKDVSEDVDAKIETDGVKASEHPVYQRFFKMLQFGVPAQAVKNKMQIEGVDPDILNDPSRTVEVASSND